MANTGGRFQLCCEAGANVCEYYRGSSHLNNVVNKPSLRWSGVSQHPGHSEPVSLSNAWFDSKDCACTVNGDKMEGNCTFVGKQTKHIVKTWWRSVWGLQGESMAYNEYLQLQSFNLLKGGKTDCCHKRLKSVFVLIRSVHDWQMQSHLAKSPPVPSPTKTKRYTVRSNCDTVQGCGVYQSERLRGLYCSDAP